MKQSKKRLRNLIHILKDKASVISATLSFSRHVSSVHVSVLRATTHRLAVSPSESHIVAVLSAGHRSHLLLSACIDALIDRLHRTRSATVALKCLFTLHNIIARGPITLRDLAAAAGDGGHNSLNLAAFRDDSDVESSELSLWVRWYAGVLEQSMTVSRVLGYYLNKISKNNNGEQERKHLGKSIPDFLYKIDVLVGFVEQVSGVPLYLQRNELIYEMVRLVGEDYRSVQYEILMRVEELGNRVADLDAGEMTELVGYLTRLEDCRERLVLLFVNRKRNYGFWDLIEQTKTKVVTRKTEIEGKWMTVTTSRRNESGGEWTRFVNPFLPIDPNRFSLTVG